MNIAELNVILNKIKNVTVGMIGDICLDAYWHADMKMSVLSNETPHYPLPVVKETYSLGGGGNVVSNLAAVGVKRVIPVSVLGDDWRGMIVSKCLMETGADCSYIITDKTRVSPCYVKPMRHGISDVIYEDPRLDFENRAYPAKETEDKVIYALEKTAAEADIIAVCDQTLFGTVSPSVIEKLNEIGKKMPVVSDSHSHINQFRNVIVKPNEREA
ncbi:MAG: sugar kinase, partial [Clostridia bacterium]|nr:sugar kinase [Clostridia bacterium]